MKVREAWFETTQNIDLKCYTSWRMPEASKGSKQICGGKVHKGIYIPQNHRWLRKSLKHLSSDAGR